MSIKTVKTWKNGAPYFLISIFYFITRVPFIRAYPVFYDSFEYVRIGGKLNWQNISSFLTLSHQPIHTFYFITALLLKTLLPRLSSEYIFSLISLFFGFATTIIWYLILKKKTNPKTAFFGTIILLLFPYFYIANTHILYESELLFFQVISFYLLLIGKEENNKKVIFFSGLLLGIAHLIFIGTLFVIPIFFYVLILGTVNKKNRLALSIALFLLGFLLTAGILDIFTLRSIQIVIAKYISHAGDIVSASQGFFYVVGRVVRNVLFQTMAILSPGGFLLLIISCVYTVFKKKYINVVIILILCLPFLVLMQYWHAGFFGRLAIGLIFPASFSIARIFENSKAQIGKIVFLLLFFMWIPLRQSTLPPIYSYYNLIKNETNIAVITSDYNRFIYEKYHIPHFVIKGETTPGQIETFIKSVRSGQIILIDSAALRYPYFQYDGDTYNIMSTRSNGAPLIKNLLDSYTYKEYKKQAYSDIFFLQIERKNKT